uniref:MFS transporter, SP family, solute carrier family 2 (Myo-inositol transporter), member 13 n=1 Tax=Tetraselmis sp. GSL018 TaxID=582737 RepID=A0A061R4J4_9CHLO
MDLSPAALSNEEVQARELVGVTREPSLRDAFTPAVKLELLLGIGLQVLQQMAGINTVMYFTPAILEMAGFRDKRQQLLAAMLPAGTNAAGTLVGLYTIDRFGRRPLMLASLGGVFVSLSLLAFAFSQTDGRFLPIGQSNCTRLAASTCGECIASGCHFCYSGSGLGVHAGACVDSPDMCLDMAEPLAAFSDSCPRVHPWIVLAGLILYIAAFAPGCGPVPWAVNSEIYPVQVRGVAGGAAATANWLTNALVSQTFLLMTAFLGEPGTFAAYAAIVLVGLLWVHVVMPETKGLSLEEIQGVFASKAKRRTLNENVRLF